MPFFLNSHMFMIVSL